MERQAGRLREAAGAISRNETPNAGVVANFERVGGEGSATAANLNAAASNLEGGAAALRSDGSDGRVANAVDTETYVRDYRGTRSGAALVQNNGPVMIANAGHPAWQDDRIDVSPIVGHESLHTAGMNDQRGSNNAYAYPSNTRDQRAAYDELTGTPRALVNPEHLMSLVSP